MFTVGSVGRHYHLVYWPTHSQYVSRVSANTQWIYQPRFRRVLTECRLGMGQVSVNMLANMVVVVVDT